MHDRVKVSKREYDYRLIQDGVQVARVICNIKDDAEREISHYAMMYGQDGPLKIVRRSRKG